MDVQPLTLASGPVRLEPLAREHASELLEAAQPDEIWDWMFSRLNSREALEQWLEQALAAQEAGREVPFAVLYKGQAVGSTRYMNIEAAHRGLEIGWTWYHPCVWGTVVNPQAKRLLLGHAFEQLEAIRVCLKTDHRNEHSQAAILKLGARFEGKLRNHMIRPDGSIRHTMMYSITAAGWPGVRDQLDQRLEALRD